MHKLLKHSLLSALILFVFAACKKETEALESHVYFEINQVPYSFKSKTELSFYFGGLAIQTTGKEKPTDVLHINTPKLRIIVHDTGTPIQQGLYTGKTYSTNGSVKEVSMSYTHNSNAPDSLYQSAFHDPVTEIRINHISRDGVRGTFSGEVYKPGNEDTLIIKNGSFAIYTYHHP